MKKYGVAALLVALAAGLSFVLRPMLAHFPGLAPLLFLCAIAVAARYVDFAPGIFAVCASGCLLDLFFFPEPPQYSILGVALAKTIFFLALGSIICVIMHNLREARASRVRLAAIVESSNDAIISLDLQGKITSWNAAAIRIFGYPPQDMIGQSVLKIIPPEFHDQESTILRNLTDGRRIAHFETEALRHDGSHLKVSLTISPLVDWKGRVIGASRIARDVTERVKMQNAFIESEKLAATGRMAAAIAHEINNPLEAVTNLAFLIKINPSLDDSAREYAGMLMDEINRMSNVAKRSLTFFRDTGKPADFDVAATLDSVLDLNKPLFAQKTIAVRRNYAGPFLVFGSSAEMRQVFSNLIRNAIDAVATEGQIEIRIRAAKDDCWRISVADNGLGIPPEARQRLFQPFVTTKGNTGNGLGLWISQGIVEKHGGRIRARSVRLAGNSWTVFSVILPRSRAAESESSQTTPSHQRLA